MNYIDVLTEIGLVIDNLDSAIISMSDSEENKKQIDVGSVGYDLKITISKLGGILKSIKNSDDKIKLKSTKDSIENIKSNIKNIGDISETINGLEDDKSTIIDFKSKLLQNGSL